MHNSLLTSAAETLLSHPRWVLVTHRQADGDALGSLLGLARMLRARGIEVIAYHPEPITDRLRAFRGDEIVDTLPATVATALGGEWKRCALDCGDQRRVCAPRFREGEIELQIDHHASNPGYAAVNLVDAGAASTTELIWRLGNEIDTDWTAEIGDPLWVGLVTDTGGFGYEKAGASSHQMAAELIEAGVEPARWRQELYGRVSFGQLRAQADMVQGVQSFHESSVLVGVYTQESLDRHGVLADDLYETADALRDIDGVALAVGGRPLGPGQPFKCSARTSHPEIDLTLLAQRFGGGGHQRAAGFLWTGGFLELGAAIEQAAIELYAPQLGLEAA
jgi:bifunctional oligoribonuclease and PAP phosphatase NrnA